MMVKCDPIQGKYMAYGLMYRSDVAPKDVDAAVAVIKTKRMAVDYGKKSRLSFAVWACPQIAMAVVEPHNTVMCVRSVLELTDLTVVMDSEAAYEGCCGNSDIVRFTYNQLTVGSRRPSLH